MLNNLSFLLTFEGDTTIVIETLVIMTLVSVIQNDISYNSLHLGGVMYG